MEDVLAGFSGLEGLNDANIDKFVAGGSIGVYVLDKAQPGPFKVYYVGRSDTDVAKRLKTWVADGGYGYFKFRYMASAKAAYELECKIYHALSPTDNDIHPDAPNGTSYTCPVSGCVNAQKMRRW